MSPISQDYQSLYKQHQGLPPDLNDISLYGLDNENLSPPTSRSPQFSSSNSNVNSSSSTTIPSIVFTDCSGGGDFNRGRFEDYLEIHFDLMIFFVFLEYNREILGSLDLELEDLDIQLLTNSNTTVADPSTEDSFRRDRDQV